MNYGDSLIEEVSIKLKSPNTTGILIEHQGDPQGTSYYVVNNVLLNRVQVNSAGVPTGTVGIWLRRVVRAALVNIDVEFIDTADKIEGVVASGNAGSTRHVSFVNCYVLNCYTPWSDSNGTLPGSVMRCFFTNCNGFSPIGATGVASTDANAHAGEGDTFLPNSLWLTEPNSGQSGVQLRAPNPGQLLLTGDFWDGTSAVRDGNTKNRSPRQALGVDITSFNVTQLYRPRGATSTDLRASCWATARPSSPTAPTPPRCTASKWPTRSISPNGRRSRPAATAATRPASCSTPAAPPSSARPPPGTMSVRASTRSSTTAARPPSQACGHRSRPGPASG